MNKAASQTLINVKYIGLSGHLKVSPHPHLYTRKIDKKGFTVLNIGVIAGVERNFIKNWFSVKFVQAVFSDCASQPAGFTHIGVRFSFANKNHHFSIGNGPTIFYRKDWLDLPGYVDEGLFKRKDKVQYIFFWYAGEVEYNYRINEKMDIGITIIPGPPEFFTLAPGIRMRL
jgi:hypothetical protein